MIQAFQRFSKSPIAKAFLIIVALSFGVFFGGTQFFGNRSRVLAEVGDTTVSLREFSNMLEQSRRGLENQMQQSISMEQMFQTGFANQVLNDLITIALLDQEAKSMGLAVSDMEVLDQIYREKRFQNDNGEFDRNRFDSLLRASRLTEDQYVNEIKHAFMREQLLGAVTSGAFVPKLLSDSMLKTQLQIRQGATVTIEAKNMALPDNPGDETLEAFYTEQKDMFMLPERRSFSILFLTPKAVMSELDITDEALREEFEATRDQYEGKTFAQVKDKVQESLVAQLAADRLYELSQQLEDEIAGGSTFEEIAKAYTLEFGSGADIEMTQKWEVSDFTPEHLRDEDVHDQVLNAVFQTEEGFESTFTETVGGNYFIVRVDQVKPAQPLVFEEIKDQVYRQWAQIEQLRQAFENAQKIAQGINLGTIPGTLKLLPNISLSTPVQDVPEDVVSALYTIAPGNATLVPGEGGFTVVMLKKIIPANPQVVNAEREKIEKQATVLLQEDLQIAYVNSLKIRHSVQVNWDLFRALAENS